MKTSKCVTSLINLNALKTSLQPFKANSNEFKFKTTLLKFVIFDNAFATFLAPLASIEFYCKAM